MDVFRIQGGRRLSGRIAVEGSKNATLPLMAAALVCDAPVVLRNVPVLSDIENMGRLLAELGCRPRFEGDALRLENVDTRLTHARYEVVRTMRASICVLGPLLARRGHARVSMPGGCAIGDRPVDLHLRGLRALGARITLDNGDIVATAPRLVGATIFLGGPFGSTVLGTTNIMTAAALAEGTTIIESAACEPEVVEVADLLIAMGAKISGAGGPRIRIEGVKELGAPSGSVEHEVMPDRIVAGTYAIAAAMTNGDVVLDDFPYDALLAVIDRFAEIGVEVTRVEPGPNQTSQDARRCSVRVSCQRRLRPSTITTQPHPGFPTDLQAQFMALLCLAEGNSIITEKIYPERFLHVAELSRMGAKLYRQGPTVVVAGPNRLTGAPVMASDLRASAGLVLAGLAAEGETIVNRVYHLDRGYMRMEEALNALGADIVRENPERDEEQPAAEAA
ncbi:MAG TPA: UDP-N-acetylglucosamine 1-carboxyvinyltransferase [Phycisphaerales bacterium]|nr:UDP-N-acetylglucosamine 1-carboxyvinyltransferase [Phycisphaerales bacterium]HMP38180.1 UDP-N-acetylglucosamine 1-carboxyvinyltransferase [Phycisphaerales bacterium]